ncbi:hypothetical protein SPRG_07295 [Saprolegnia parasitica CBS 223.65]|uniref:CCD97-like C-terminal domain-containing protein n=1 Tax=Saprolegnia parasitica (strain CBS 223.65) TaxID=695850 RepID=A0A067CET8_SAPPC|nr:hypothetical protein SPRG_07295 [Saprolegnia parasitica CBS 223.65]KDO27665.1 hypothetical protein SPRG_07295 [Saprolegnia parasitica CBS 223.65]|eukprot:XP_012201477.1 hypothetical protein SPRG_07295 [Saprolegnia parasitica CBS 223.65]
MADLLMDGLTSMGMEDDNEEDPLDAYMRTLEAAPTIREPATTARDFQRRLAPGGLDARIKNRRYCKLQELLRTSDYFSDENMERRSPSLFHFHLGRYIPPNTSARAEPASLSTFLMASMDKQALEARKEEEESTWGVMRQHRPAPAKEPTMDKHPTFEEEFDSDSDDEAQDESMDGAEADPHGDDNDEMDEMLSVADRRQQLIDVMCQRFLQGLDVGFTKYDEVDGSIAYDDFTALTRDAQDAYFDDA